MPAALGMMAGIVLFYASASWIIPTSALLIGIATFAFKRHWFTFCALFVALGWLLTLIARPPLPSHEVWNVRTTWIGEITDIHTTSSATRLTVKLDSCEHNKITPFKCAVLLPNPTDRFIPGDIVAFQARLYDPDMAADLPDENRFNPTFFVDGITAQANVSPDDITIISVNHNFRRTAYEWQTDVRDLIYRSPVSSPTAWFLSATLIGDDTFLDTSLRQQFRATGAAHYLALSGFHIGIIALIASTILFPFKIWSHFGRLRHLLVITIVWLYAFTCGMAPSLVRAAVLITIFLLAKVLQRQSSPYNSLCVAAIVILAFSPRQLFAPGFQLSFCAVLSILTFSRAFNPIKDQRSRLYRLASFVTVPVAAMLGTCLISMLHFHRFPLLFLLPNLLLAVLLPLLLALGVVLVASTAFGVKLTFIGAFADFIYKSISKLCETLSALPNAEITGIFLSPITIIAAALAIIILAVACHTKRRLMFIISAAAMMCDILFQTIQPALPHAELYITRQPQRTDIIVRDCDSTIIYTTAKQKDHHAIAARLSARYANFLSRRNCHPQLTATDSDFTFRSIRLRNNYIIFNDKTLLIPNASLKSVNPTISVNYLVISRAVGNRPFEIVKTIVPDTVIIARDMPSIRALRLIDSCRAYSIPYIHLINQPFSLTLIK